MALATRCPHCQTTFRVAHDQLKLRAGLVRCGACKEIFNGVEHLLRPDEMQQVLARPAPTPAPRPDAGAVSLQAKASPPSPEAPAITASTPPAADTPQTDDGEPDQAGPDAPEAPPVESSMSREADKSAAEDIGSAPEIPAPGDSTITDPLQRMTLMDFTAFDTQLAYNDSRDDTDHPEHTYSDSENARSNDEANTHDELSQAIDDLQNKPWRREKAGRLRRAASGNTGKGGKAEPGFMARARRQQRYGKAMRLTMGTGSVILFIALLGQSVFAFRDTIAATLPEYRPVLTELCARLGCQVRLPARIDKVSIESSELQSLPSAPNRFTLAALLRNQATNDQAWPYLELTLNDMNEKPVARKVFQPRDYLTSSQGLVAGFPAQSEQQVKISFELQQLKAAGYRLYLFYP